MGEVYRALDTRLQRHIAIKVLPEELTSSVAATERFQREARMASILNHPNICTIYDVGTEPPFIAMELLEGESLHQRLRRGPLDIASLVTIAIGATEGLEAAHSHGFIHRDIKPANIFLTPHGPKLLDFGLAKARAGSGVGELSSDRTKSAETLLTDAGVAVGTIAYMSPEQLRGEELDARTDIFSLGLVLYEMAAGQPAFAGATSAAISGATLYERPAPPREINAAIPAHLSDTILTMLEKNREDRCQTAADLRADLRRLKRELDSAINTSADSGRSGHGRTGAVVPNRSPSGHSRFMPRRSIVAVVSAAAIASVAAGVALFYRDAPRTTAIAPLSLDGVHIEQLTSTGDALRPALAPDGRYLAYIRLQDGALSLHVRQAATAATVEIVPPEPGVGLFGATVSPDSAFVDYVRRAQGQPFELWRVPFLGGVPKLVRGPVHSPIGWSLDGRQYAFIRADSSRGSTSVVVVNADGSEERVLAERERPAQFVSLMITTRPSIAPAWSRNGRLLAVVGAGAGADPGDGDLTFIDVATGGQHSVPLPSNAVRGLVWYDEGTLLLNAAQPGSSLQLHQLSYPTGRLEPLTRDVNDYDGISLAADGRTLICSRRERRTELAVVDPTGRVLVSGPGIDMAALRTDVTAINWAGDRVLYGKWAWRPGSAPQQVLEEGQETAGSLDGRTLVFHKGNGLWKADGKGGAQSLLVAGDAWGPTVTPDNRSVIFNSSRTGNQSPWMVSLDGGEPRQLVNRYLGSLAVAVSPDGKSIAFASRDEQSSAGVVVACELDGCRQQHVFRDLGLTRLRWTPSGRAITYIDAATQRNLWTVPVAGGPPAQLTRFDDRIIVDFDWAPDGKRLAVARRLETNDIVMLQGLHREVRR